MTLYQFKDLIGTTPLIKIENKIFAKFETYNPSGSVKDRMVAYIVETALNRREFHTISTFLEATSGNTGISLAMIGARLRKKVKIIMPYNMSTERKQLMRLFGAEIIEVGFNDFKEAIAVRDNLLKENNDYWSPHQFSNPLNIKCHRKTTGPEIYHGLNSLSAAGEKDKRMGAFIHGSGTGGTLMGVWEYFNKDLHFVPGTGNPKAIDFVLTTPAEDATSHGIQGINDGANFLLDKNILDREIAIKTDDAVEYMHKLATDKGLMVGISSAANILASKKWLEDNPDKGNVITMICDRGERYLDMTKENHHE